MKATTVTTSFAIKIIIFQKISKTLYLFDWLSRYVGYYQNQNEAVITGTISVYGPPAIYFGGFLDIYLNLPVTITGPFGTVTSKIQRFCPKNSDSSPIKIYNFNGSFIGYCQYGVHYSSKALPIGINTFEVQVDDSKITYKIIRQ